jgi:hypothetical protein
MGRQRSTWERNRVEGATVARRYEGVPPRLGRVYEAFSEKSGSPVLLVAPGNEGDWGHLPEWKLQVSSSTRAGCYSVEVLEAPQARGLPELTLALYRLARALAQVEERPEVQEAMLGHLAAQRRRRAHLQHAGRVAAVAAAVLVVVGVQHAFSEGAVTGVPGAPLGSEHSVAAGTVPGEDLENVALGEVAALVGPVATAPRQPTATSGLWLDMPKKPWPGQNLAPCEEGEVEIKLKGGARACWVEVNYRNPETCRKRGYEHDGRCYLPSYPPPKVPQSAQ